MELRLEDMYIHMGMISLAFLVLVDQHFSVAGWEFIHSD